jgi:hypothetical protein
MQAYWAQQCMWSDATLFELNQGRRARKLWPAMRFLSQGASSVRDFVVLAVAALSRRLNIAGFLRFDVVAPAQPTCEVERASERV